MLSSSAPHSWTNVAPRDGRSIVSNCFQGDVEVTMETSKGTLEVNTETTRTTYLHLTLDIPPPPLFRDAIDANALPQVCGSSLNVE
jgi:U4/U6.U5 tri-snRNP-associated protein 2